MADECKIAVQKNRVNDYLSTGEIALGTWVQTASPEIVETWYGDGGIRQYATLAGTSSRSEADSGRLDPRPAVANAGDRVPSHMTMQEVYSLADK